MRNNRSKMQYHSNGYPNQNYDMYLQSDARMNIPSEMGMSNRSRGILNQGPLNTSQQYMSTDTLDMNKMSPGRGMSSTYSNSLYSSQQRLGGHEFDTGNTSFSNTSTTYPLSPEGTVGSIHSRPFSRESNSSRNAPLGSVRSNETNSLSSDQDALSGPRNGFSSPHSNLFSMNNVSLAPPPSMGYPNSQLSSPEYSSRPPGLDYPRGDGSPMFRQTFQQSIPHMDTVNDMYPSYEREQDLFTSKRNGMRSSMYSSQFYPVEQDPYRSMMDYPSNSLYQSELFYPPNSMNRSMMDYQTNSLNRSMMDYQPNPIHQSMMDYQPNAMNRSMMDYQPNSMNRSFMGYDMNPEGSYEMGYQPMNRSMYGNTMQHSSQFNRSGYGNNAMQKSGWDAKMTSTNIPSLSILPPSQYTNKGSTKPTSLYRSEGGQPLNYPLSEANTTIILEKEEQELQVSTAIELRKDGLMDEALRVLLQIRDSAPPSLELYLELIRVYSDQGDFFNAEKMAEEGLQALPDTEELLEKWIRTEERIGNSAKILKAVNALLNKDSYRVVKTIVDTCTNLCKLNNAYQVRSIFSTLFSRNLCKQGNLIHHYATYLYRSVSAQQAIEYIEASLDTYAKHGPMWFTLFQYLEAQNILSWDCQSVKERVLVHKLYDYYDKAVNIMSTELRWKVFYVATQMVLRIITHLRIVLHTNVDISLLPEYNHYIPLLYSLLQYYLIRCFNCCPSNLKWKVLLLMGRVSAFQGNKMLTHKLFERAQRCTPIRNIHAMLFEVSRILEYTGDTDGMQNVILAGMKFAPTEWKLALERIHQFMKKGDYKAALHLNKEVVLQNKGAGRLWASLIQIIHQMHGPALAFFVFIYSLQFVAKSGEVWCEGGRIFLNPCSSLFSVHNAQYCLNLAVYFTPQYGDSFIESLRLYLLTSDVFLLFASSPNTYLLYLLLTSLPIQSILARCQYSDPNYGSCWFKAKVYPLNTAEEVLIRALKLIAWELAWHADLYYAALRKEAKQKQIEREQGNYGNAFSQRNQWMESGWNSSRVKFDALSSRLSTESIHPSFRYYTFAFKPDQMICCRDDVSSVKKMMLLFGTSQIEA